MRHICYLDIEEKVKILYYSEIASLNAGVNNIKKSIMYS